MKSTRRSFLKTTGVMGSVTASALYGVGAAGAHATIDHRARGEAVSPEIEGTWLVTVSLDIPDFAPFPALVSFARGGTLISSDSGVRPESGNIYLGTWAKTKSREYAFTFLGFQFDKGQFANYIRGSETLKLEAGGSIYKGVTKVEVLDKNMNPVQAFAGTTLANRVNVM